MTVRACVRACVCVFFSQKFCIAFEDPIVKSQRESDAN
jgi:hypothetical protein